MNPRMTPGAEAPFDEAALRALFEEVDAPPSLARWRDRIELSTSTDVDQATSSAGPVELRPARRVRPWVRAAAAGFAALTVGAGIVGVVAANRHPSPAPPDPTIIETTTTGWPSTSASGPSTTAPTGSATGTSAPPGAPPAAGSGPPNGQQPNGQPPNAPNPLYPGGTPVPVPMTGWPDAGNTGAPPGTNLRVHSGDLWVTTPGAVVSDLRVEGVVHVQAPDVTLVRMLVVPPAGSQAGVSQAPQAPRLTVEHSQIEGGSNRVRFGIEQKAAGLTVRRCDIHGAESAVSVSDDATIVDSLLGGGLGTVGASTRVTVRHNTIGGLDIRDRIGPVTDMSIDNNLLRGGILAPTGSGSRDIRVTNNQFQGYTGEFDPSHGWNGQAPGNVWTGNVWSRSGEPANP